MNKIIAVYGDNITQRINGVFPDGGLGSLAGYALKAVNTATGAGLMNHALDAQSYIMKKLWGGMFFPGIVTIYDDKVEFKPSFFVKIPIYQGIQLVSFPYSQVMRIEKVKKGPLKLSGLKICLYDGEFLIMAPFDTNKIVASLLPFVNVI